MKICISIAPRSMDEALIKLREVGKKADLVEVRVDGIGDLDLRRLLQQPRPQLLITNRLSVDGGTSTGSARKQYEILSTAIAFGAEYIDVELSWGRTFVRQLLRQSKRTKVICSYHNFRETPDNLSSIYRKMQSTGSHIVKIATMARDVTDAARMNGLLGIARQERRHTIAFCMGEAGEVSRILCSIWGGYMTFASLSAGEPTAPGQQAVENLKKVFRVDTLDRQTKVFGLVGNPVKFSRGIHFHNRRFARAGVNAVYVNFLVNDLACFLQTFHHSFRGLSITMPFKREIVPLLDRVDSDAERLGAVNTVVKRHGKLIGTNTDLPALISSLKRHTSIRRRTIVVLGTGSMARTMVYASIANGGDTTILGRSSENVKRLADEFGCSWLPIERLMETRADILLNGTSVGMGEARTLVPREYFRRGMVVLDAVSDPPMTLLLNDASSAGCRTISGVDLFRRQANLQSKIFLECLK